MRIRGIGPRIDYPNPIRQAAVRRRCAVLDESGYTLVEMLITMMIFSIIAAMAYSLVTTTSQNGANSERLGDATTTSVNTVREIEQIIAGAISPSAVSSLGTILTNDCVDTSGSNFDFNGTGNISASSAVVPFTQSSTLESNSPSEDDGAGPFGMTVCSAWSGNHSDPTGPEANTYWIYFDTSSTTCVTDGVCTLNVWQYSPAGGTGIVVTPIMSVQNVWCQLCIPSVRAAAQTVAPAEVPFTYEQETSTGPVDLNPQTNTPPYTLQPPLGAAGAPAFSDSTYAEINIVQFQISILADTNPVTVLGDGNNPPRATVQDSLTLYNTLAESSGPSD